ncbi:MAG: HEAT repeat domain-containing protein [Phycisphaerae bacterium]|nr:HEAT repeat domain-containing protein [Phycisphaerae bacterium]
MMMRCARHVPVERFLRHCVMGVGATVAAIALTACAPSATEGGFSNPAPGARIYAIEDAVKFNRRDQIPQIVECLCSDDDLLRYMAIGALQRMTGQDLGYQFDDPDPLRFAAYQRWRQWTIDQHLAPPEQAYASTIYPPARQRPSW